MMIQATISLAVLALLVARAVNIPSLVGARTRGQKCHRRTGEQRRERFSFHGSDKWLALRASLLLFIFSAGTSFQLLVQSRRTSSAIVTGRDGFVGFTLTQVCSARFRPFEATARQFEDSSMSTARRLHMQGYDGRTGGRKTDDQLSSGRVDLLCRSGMPYTRGLDGHPAKEDSGPAFERRA